MKYIIELEDTPISVKDSHTGEAYDVYKAKGFRSIVFDLNGLHKLERYEQQSAYQKGYEAGLAEGRQQEEGHDGCQGCYYEPCGEDEEPCRSCKYRYKSQYRRYDDEIRVGDEVVYHAPFNDYTGFVIEVQSADVLTMMLIKDGIWSVRRRNVEKTGRHFPEVEKLLEAMKE